MMLLLPRNIQALACCAGACLQSFCTWGNFNRRTWGIFNRRKLGNFQPALTQGADLFTQYQGTLESERSEYLLRCVIDDLKWLRGELHNVTQKQEEYLSKDWVELLFDADKKARATRAKTRIERIATILCSSIRIEPKPAADQTEEMMRIATELTDDDVLVLRQLREAVDKYSRLPANAVHTLSAPEILGVTPDSVLESAGTSESRPDRR